MPKIIDHNERRTVVAEATWKVIEQVGIEAATLRMIATEMGVSTGTLGHYFSNKDQLVEFAFRHAVALVFAKIAAETVKLEPGIARLRYALQAMMPNHINSIPAAAASATLSYWGVAAARPALAAVHRTNYAEWRSWLATFLREAQDRGEIGSDLNVDEETSLLIAVADGVLVGSVLEPEHFAADASDALLDSVIERLKVPAGRVA